MKNLSTVEFLKLVVKLAWKTFSFRVIRLALKYRSEEWQIDHILKDLKDGTKGCKEILLAYITIKKFRDEDETTLVKSFIDFDCKDAKEVLKAYMKAYRLSSNAEVELAKGFVKGVAGTSALLQSYCLEENYSMDGMFELEILKGLGQDNREVINFLYCYIDKHGLENIPMGMLITYIEQGVKEARVLVKANIKQREFRGHNDVELVKCFAQGADGAQELLELYIEKYRLSDAATLELVKFFATGAKDVRLLLETYAHKHGLGARYSFDTSKAEVELVKCLGDKKVERTEDIFLASFRHGNLCEAAQLDLVNSFINGVSGADNVLRQYVALGCKLSDKVQELLAQHIYEATDEAQIGKAVRLFEMYVEKGQPICEKAQIWLVKCEGKAGIGKMLLSYCSGKFMLFQTAQVELLKHLVC